jgi:NDP-mannose synthase
MSNQKEKRVIILAGGKGTRLEPYTISFPKPLMPIGKYPILEIIIRQLVHFGYTHITITVNHQAEIIKAFFGNGDKWGVKIDYSFETSPLGTMGPLTLISDLPEDFLVMNGDVLTDLNYSEFFQDHLENEALFTISSFIRLQKNEYGVLVKNSKDLLTVFQEKPVTKFEVSMGVYAVSKKLIDLIPVNKPYGFDDLMIKLIGSNKKVRVNMFDGYWLDIGRPDDYRQAIDEFELSKSKFLPND